MCAHALLVLLSLSIIIKSCKRDSTTPLKIKSELTIDFQGGFESDKIQIFVDGILTLNDTISTAPHNGFAYRFEDHFDEGNHIFRINVDDTLAVIDTLLNLKHSVFCIVILDRLQGKLLFRIIDKLPTYENQSLNDLEKLGINVLSVFGHQSFYYPPPPDPIIIKIELYFESLINYKVIDDIDFINAKIYKTNDQLIGEFDLIPLYDVNVYPLEADTVTAVKVAEDSQPFQAPCWEHFYVTFDIRDQYNNILSMKTDSTLFTSD